MATATEALAGTMAEGPTSHTQNQASGLSAYQLRMLHGGINPNRVRTLNKLSHLEAWDVRRQLIRIFGFGGYSIETLSLDLVHEERKDNHRKRNKQGEEYGAPYTAWTIVYRAQIRLTVFDTQGREICHWEDGAAGDAINQPSVGDAHDMAMKTSLSQALKRCAVNLGDQFGLSLYNGGSRDAVVGFSAAHPPQEWKQMPAPQPEPEDPPVKGEPDAVADAEEPVPGTPAAAVPTVEQREDVRRQEQAGGTTLEALKQKINAGWSNRISCQQNLEDARIHGLLDETVKVGELDVRVEDLLTRRIAQLKEQAVQNNNSERSAA